MLWGAPLFAVVHHQDEAADTRVFGPPSHVVAAQYLVR